MGRGCSLVEAVCPEVVDSKDVGFTLSPKLFERLLLPFYAVGDQRICFIQKFQ